MTADVVAVMQQVLTAAQQTQKASAETNRAIEEFKAKSVSEATHNALKDRVEKAEADLGAINTLRNDLTRLETQVENLMKQPQPAPAAAPSSAPESKRDYVPIAVAAIALLASVLSAIITLNAGG